MSLYGAHFKHLKEWNEKISLVSRKSIDQSFAPHYADSLFISDFVNRLYPKGPVYDVGTGAGFPGLVFAIRYPEREVFLYEKLQKKKPYLESAIATLGLKNVRLRGAFESAKEPALFMARAVMPRGELLDFFRKRIPMGGLVVLNLGGTPKEDEFPPLGFKLLAAERYTLPDGAGDRRIELYEHLPSGAK